MRFIDQEVIRTLQTYKVPIFKMKYHWLGATHCMLASLNESMFKRLLMFKRLQMLMFKRLHRLQFK